MGFNSVFKGLMQNEMYEAYHTPEGCNPQRYRRIVLYCNFYVLKPGKMKYSEGSGNKHFPHLVFP